MITKDKVTEIFCIIDEFDKNLSELSKNLRLPSVGKDGIRHRNRPGRLSESEIMTILVCYHFGTYRTFKDYYLCCIRGSMKDCFPDAVSYNRFVELTPRVFLLMMLFMRLHAFGISPFLTQAYPELAYEYILALGQAQRQRVPQVSLGFFLLAGFPERHLARILELLITGQQNGLGNADVFQQAH